MRIGVRAHDYGRQAAGHLAAAIRAAGFETVQLALTKAITGIERFEDISDATLDVAREGFALAGVRIDVMGCYVELGAANDEQRRGCVAQFRRGLSQAARLGAPLVASETTNFHGTGTQREVRYANLLDGMLRIAEEAERVGVTACVEPVAIHTLHSAALARRLLDDVGSDRLKIVFDPVNMLTIENLGDQDAILHEYFQLLGPDIAAVHLKDINERLEWRNLGSGLVHYGLIFEKLRALGRDLPLLREDANLCSASLDIAAIRSWIDG